MSLHKYVEFWAKCDSCGTSSRRRAMSKNQRLLLLAVFLILSLRCGGGDTTPQGPEDIRRNLRADWRDSMICYREQDWCACCYGSNTAYCYENYYTSFTFVPCKVPEKMGLRIY